MLVIRIIMNILTGIFLYYICKDPLGMNLSAVLASLYVLCMVIKEINEDQIDTLKDKVKNLEKEIKSIKDGL